MLYRYVLAEHQGATPPVSETLLGEWSRRASVVACGVYLIVATLYVLLMHLRQQKEHGSAEAVGKNEQVFAVATLNFIVEAACVKPLMVLLCSVVFPALTA